jgi:hypothetical protein
MSDPIAQAVSVEWIEASIHIMNVSMHLGARLYPFLCGLGLLRTIISVV